MARHADNWVYGGLLNISSMEATQLRKDVIQALRDSGLLLVLAFPCSAFYQDLVDSFYLHMKGENDCLSLNGEILGVPVSFSPHTLLKAFLGLRNSPITEKTYTDGWLVMRGSDSQPNAYDNKKSLYEPIDYALADIIDRCWLLKSGGHDKITEAQQEIMGAIRLKKKVRWSEILFNLIRNNVIAVRINTPLAGRKSEPVMMYHILISHFLCHYTTIANNLNNFIATPVELAKVFDVHDIQRASNVVRKKRGATIPVVPRRQKRKAEEATDAYAEEVQPKPKVKKPKPKPTPMPQPPKPKPYKSSAKPSTRASFRYYQTCSYQQTIQTVLSLPLPLHLLGSIPLTTYLWC